MAITREKALEIIEKHGTIWGLDYAKSAYLVGQNEMFGHTELSPAPYYKIEPYAVGRHGVLFSHNCPWVEMHFERCFLTEKEAKESVQKEFEESQAKARKAYQKAKVQCPCCKRSDLEIERRINRRAGL